MRKPKQRRLYEQLGLKPYMIKGLYTEILAYQAGLKNKEELIESFKESIAHNPYVVKRLQRIKKGWHLKGKPAEEITAFLEMKFDSSPQRRVNELIDDIETQLKKHEIYSFYRRDSMILDLYEKIKAELPDSRQRTVILNNLSDIAAENDPKAYLSLIDSKVTQKLFPHKMRDGSLFLYIGASQAFNYAGWEFNRNLDGRIVQNARGLSIDEVEDEEYQRVLQKTYSEAVRQATQHMNKIKTSGWGYKYRSNIQGDAAEAEALDDKIVEELKQRYGPFITRSGDYITIAFHGIVNTVKGVVFRPEFLKSFDKHPREVAEDLIREVGRFYRNVA